MINKVEKILIVAVTLLIFAMYGCNDKGGLNTVRKLKQEAVYKIPLRLEAACLIDNTLDSIPSMADNLSAIDLLPYTPALDLGFKSEAGRDMILTKVGLRYAKSGARDSVCHILIDADPPIVFSKWEVKRILLLPELAESLSLDMFGPISKEEWLAVAWQDTVESPSPWLLLEFLLTFDDQYTFHSNTRELAPVDLSVFQYIRDDADQLKWFNKISDVMGDYNGDSLSTIKQANLPLDLKVGLLTKNLLMQVPFRNIAAARTLADMNIRDWNFLIRARMEFWQWALSPPYPFIPEGERPETAEEVAEMADIIKSLQDHFCETLALLEEPCEQTLQ